MTSRTSTVFTVTPAGASGIGGLPTSNRAPWHALRPRCRRRGRSRHGRSVVRASSRLSHRPLEPSARPLGQKVARGFDVRLVGVDLNQAVCTSRLPLASPFAPVTCAPDPRPDVSGCHRIKRNVARGRRAADRRPMPAALSIIEKSAARSEPGDEPGVEHSLGCPTHTAHLLPTRLADGGSGPLLDAPARRRAPTRVQEISEACFLASARAVPDCSAMYPDRPGPGLPRLTLSSHAVERAYILAVVPARPGDRRPQSWRAWRDRRLRRHLLDRHKPSRSGVNALWPGPVD